MRKSIPDNIEIRDALIAADDGDVALAPVELRADDTEFDGVPGYDGHFATWNTVDSYGTFFVKGAFKKTLKERGSIAPVLWQHWPDMPIGTHLVVNEDKNGVFARTQLIEGVRAADEALALMRGGVHLGLSFGFQTVKDRTATDDDDLDFSVAPKWAKSAPREELRAITEVLLWESSPVTFAANEKAAPSKIRNLADPDFLSTLLDAIKAGELDEQRTALLKQIVAAYEARAGAGITDDHSTPEMARRAHALSMLTLLTADAGYLMETDQWLTN